jgi:hypothetical protein
VKIDLNVDNWKSIQLRMSFLEITSSHQTLDNKDANFDDEKSSALTLNNALTVAKSGSGLVDFNFHSNRGKCRDEIWKLMSHAWNTPLKEDESTTNGLYTARTYTLRCLCHLRDIRNGGKGERQVWFYAYEWLVYKEPKIAEQFLLDGLIEEFGSWRDVIMIATYCPDDDLVNTARNHTDIQIVELNDQYPKTMITANWKRISKIATLKLVDQIVKDASAYWQWKIGKENKPPHISLVSKWIPSQGCKFDVLSQKINAKTWLTNFAALIGTHKITAIAEDIKILQPNIIANHIDRPVGIVTNITPRNIKTISVSISTISRPVTNGIKSKCPITHHVPTSPSKTVLIKGKKEHLRKYILTPLRKHLDIIERLMSQNKWNNIDFSKVPSKTFQLMKNKFKEKCGSRFTEHVSKVQSKAQTILKGDDDNGTQIKINTSAIHPHEILKDYFDYVGSDCKKYTSEDEITGCRTQLVFGKSNSSDVTAENSINKIESDDEYPEDLVICVEPVVEKVEDNCSTIHNYTTDPRFNSATEASWFSFIANLKTQLRDQTRQKLISEGHTDISTHIIDTLTPYLLTISDLSRSMEVPANGTSGVAAIDIAITMGLLSAELGPKNITSEGTFGNWINFSTIPTLQPILLNKPDGSSTSVLERICQMNTINWAESTNLRGAFQLIFQQAKEKIKTVINDIIKNNCVYKFHYLYQLFPEMFLIVSDMQFDIACRGNCHTNMDIIKSDFDTFKNDVNIIIEELCHGNKIICEVTKWSSQIMKSLTLPLIVFWNVSSQGSDVPVECNTHGVALVSGFNPDIFKQILDIDINSFNPLNFVLSTLNKPHLQKIRYILDRNN